MYERRKSSIKLLDGLTIKKFEPMTNFTTWRIGGPAEFFAEPQNINEIQSLIHWSKEKQIEFRVIGAGSNLLINDLGMKGLTICLKKLHGYKLDQNDGLIEAFGGENIPSLTRKAAKAGLHGLEWAVGIPGTVGGAVVMNAGAQGGSISDYVVSVKVLPINGEKAFEIKREDLSYSYRKSRLQHEKLVVISAKFKLEPGYNYKKILDKTNSNLNQRKNTQPYHLPSCGSVFRNPEPYKAGKLIEELGLKGMRIGGAEISKMHANFIVNQGNATAQDVNNLIVLIQEKIKKAYGLKLHPEVKRLGFDSKT